MLKSVTKNSLKNTKTKQLKFAHNAEIKTIQNAVIFFDNYRCPFLEIEKWGVWCVFSGYR